jgi:hypothetical protein
MAIEVETYFVVTLTKDGGFVTYTTIPEEELKAERQATAGDVLNVSKQIANEIEQRMLIERIVNSLAEAMEPPVEPTLPDSIKEKLAERGIKPESPATSE